MPKLIQWSRKTYMMFIKSRYLILLVILFGNHFLYAAQPASMESQPEIIFQFDKLEKNQSNLALQVEFNKAVLMLEKGQYAPAIKILKSTAKILKIPSFLNIGIAYYKMDSLYNARIYLKRIYEYEEAVFTDTYSYMSACYYLYQITKNKDYLEKIISIAVKHKELSEHAKRLITDTLIVLKKYKAALKMLNSMEFPLDLKKALLYIKLRDYVNAELYLKKAYEMAINPTKLDQINWFMVFRDLKANEIDKLIDHLEVIDTKRTHFKANQQLPLQIYFNRNKYTPSEYIKFLTTFTPDRRIDYLFYFAPYVFSDNEEIIYDIARGFIFQEDQSIEALEDMVEYNANFLQFIKKDPIIRTIQLKKLLIKDTKSYIYYNLAICYAQINDYHSALKFFQKAYKLNPGNKLYSAMTLISAKRLNIKLKDNAYIEKNLKSNTGMYKYLGHTLYKLYLNPKFEMPDEPSKYKKTVFYKGMDYLMKMQTPENTINHPLMQDNFKDPLIYLMKMVLRRPAESDFGYFSRLQDEVPLKYNQDFLEGPLIVTQYYVDLIKALGLFNRAELNIDGSHTPSYLRTKAFNDLHMGNPRATVNILEYLQETYKLEDKYTMYLIVAALLEDGKYNDASVQISLIKAILNDNGADFLTGVQLIQDLKLGSAKQYFTKPYIDTLIDFRLIGFDAYLESL